MLTAVVCLSVLSVTLVYCGQTVGWIRMKLGMQVGLGTGHIVLDGDPAPLPQRSRAPIFGPYMLWQNGWMIKMPLGMEVGLGRGDFVLDGDPASPPQNRGRSPQFLAHVCCGQTAVWIKMVLGIEVGLSPGDFA